MTQPTRQRERRTFTLSDEANELITARAEVLDLNRSRFVEHAVTADVFMHLADSDLTLLQEAADDDSLELSAWIRKTALEAVAEPPVGQVFIHLDDSDLTLLQGVAEADSLELNAWMRKAALDAAAPRAEGQVFMQFDDSDLTLLREKAEADNLDVPTWVRKAALDAAAPPVLGWPTVELQPVQEPLWWRMLPPFLRRPRQDGSPSGHRRMIA